MHPFKTANAGGYYSSGDDPAQLICFDEEREDVEALHQGMLPKQAVGSSAATTRRSTPPSAGSRSAA